MEPRPLLIGNDFLPEIGGIQQFVAALAERLPNVAVVAGAHPDADDALLPYRVYRGSRRFLWPTRSTLALLRKAVSAHGANVAVITAPFPLSPVGGHLGVPFAVVCHGAELVWPAAVPGIASQYRRWLRRAACLFTVSRYTAGHLRQLVGADGPPIRLLRPGVDLGRFRPLPLRAPSAPTDPLVVSVGRLVPRKGTDVLIRALPGIRASVPGTRLIVVGDGRWRGHLERLSRRLVAGGQLSDGAVTFAGRTPPEELPTIYARADLAVMPVRNRWGGLEQEGFGMVFVEAQSCKVPVIAGRSGGAPETVIDGHTGVVVDGTDVAAVTQAAVELLTDDARRTAMGEAARSHVEQQFNWDTIVRVLFADLAAIAEQRTVFSEL